RAALRRRPDLARCPVRFPDVLNLSCLQPYSQGQVFPCPTRATQAVAPTLSSRNPLSTRNLLTLLVSHASDTVQHAPVISGQFRVAGAAEGQHVHALVLAIIFGADRILEVQRPIHAGEEPL